jgi:hypothetical protein
MKENLEEMMNDIIQINGKKTRDCTEAECGLIIEFYYALNELETIAERLRCPGAIDMPRLVLMAYRIAEETKHIRSKESILGEIIYH